MPHGRQLRLFLSDGTASGPRFYEIVNRTIQALGIPAVRIKEADSSDWPEFQKPGVYMVFGLTEDGEDRLYIGRGENVASRVQVHPEKQAFEVTRLILFSSKDENLNASQVGWLESRMIQAVQSAKRIIMTNGNCPSIPVISKAELATVSEFFDDLKLIAQTAGYDYFEKPKMAVPVAIGGSDSSHLESIPEFTFQISSRNIVARGRPSDDGFVVLEGSLASGVAYKAMPIGYQKLRNQLIEQGVLIPMSTDSEKMKFTQDYAFSAPSAAASVVAGASRAGSDAWKTKAGLELGNFLKSLNALVSN